MVNGFLHCQTFFEARTNTESMMLLKLCCRSASSSKKVMTTRRDYRIAPEGSERWITELAQADRFLESSSRDTANSFKAAGSSFSPNTKNAMGSPSKY